MRKELGLPSSFFYDGDHRAKIHGVPYHGFNLFQHSVIRGLDFHVHLIGLDFEQSVALLYFCSRDL